MSRFAGDVAIVGVGYSEVARHSDRTLGQLAVSACRRALDDCGLTPRDVDGIANFPSPSRLGAGTVDGVDVVGVAYVAHALGLDGLQWVSSSTRGTIMASLGEAANAIAAGACECALVWRGMHNPPGPFGRLRQERATGESQFLVPWGFGHNVIHFAMPYSTYMARYGATREDMATFAVRNRRYGAANPHGVFRGKAITRSEYLDARMIADPLSILDCDMPVDGCGAVVLTSGDRARRLVDVPAYVVGHTARGLPPRTRSWIFTLDMFMHSARQVADALWKSSGMRPGDVSQLQLYDGFSYFPYLWLDAFGFCGEGEGHLVLQDPCSHLDGDRPVNTGGGALAMGRLHGSPQLIEAVLQIQGRAGERQIREPTTALVQAGSPENGGVALLSSERNRARPR